VPEEKHNEWDSGWRAEADGSQWREKGASDYQKTEASTDQGYERTEKFSTHDSKVWVSGQNRS